MGPFWGFTRYYYFMFLAGDLLGHTRVVAGLPLIFIFFVLVGR